MNSDKPKTFITSTLPIIVSLCLDHNDKILSNWFIFPSQLSLMFLAEVDLLYQIPNSFILSTKVMSSNSFISAVLALSWKAYVLFLLSSNPEIIEKSFIFRSVFRVFLMCSCNFSEIPKVVAFGRSRRSTILIQSQNQTSFNVSGRVLSF